MVYLGAMFRKLPGSVFVVTAIWITIFIIGFIGGIYYLLNSTTFKDLNLSRGPLTSEPVSLNLSLSSPENNILVFSQDLLVSGKTTPGATVIISFEASDLAIDVSGSGEFSQTVILDEGINEFTVTSFDNLGNSKSEERTIYYSKEKI